MRHDLVLRRGDVTLRPLTAEDAPALRALLDAGMWAGMSAPLPATDEEMAEHLRPLVDSPTVLGFSVVRDGELIGRTTFYDLVPGLRVEVGHTVYTRSAWGTHVNPTCKLLLFTHAFEELGVERVALRCDHRNTRSHRAIARLGAAFEGTLRRYRPAADGSLADVDYFSVIREEWPAVRVGLEERLAD